MPVSHVRKSVFLACVSLLYAGAACTKDAEPERPPMATGPGDVAPDSPAQPAPASVPPGPGAAVHRAVNRAPNPAPPTAANAAKAAPADATDVTERLLAIAAEYRSYGRVDDEMRWAPFLCRIPMPASAHLSKSRHASTHGRKLYSLFARDRPGYLSIGKKLASAGQVIVKESWVPQEIDAKEAPSLYSTEPVPGAPVEKKPSPNEPAIAQIGTGDHFHPYARTDGKVYRAKERGPLFIMYKLEADSPGTDRGWVYGTVSTDGRQVTASGLIRSCMGCHKKAPHGRLFGLGYEGDSPE